MFFDFMMYICLEFYIEKSFIQRKIREFIFGLKKYLIRVYLFIDIFQFLEKLFEKVQKGIEEVNKELYKEMDEKLM